MQVEVRHLVRHDAAAHAEVEASVREMVEHAHLFDEAQRIVEGQAVHAGAETDASRPLARRGEEDPGHGRQSEGRGVVFGEMVGVEAGGIALLQQPQPAFVELLERRLPPVEMIEDPELHRSSLSPAPTRQAFLAGNRLARKVILRDAGLGHDYFRARRGASHRQRSPARRRGGLPDRGGRPRTVPAPDAGRRDRRAPALIPTEWSSRRATRRRRAPPTGYSGGCGRKARFLRARASRSVFPPRWRAATCTSARKRARRTCPSTSGPSVGRSRTSWCPFPPRSWPSSGMSVRRCWSTRDSLRTGPATTRVRSWGSSRGSATSFPPPFRWAITSATARPRTSIW